MTQKSINFTGSLSVSSLRDMEKDYFGGSIDNLLHHLEIMIPDEVICEERRKQIKTCAELKQYYDGAGALLKLKEMFKLTGEFSDIEKLAKGVIS